MITQRQLLDDLRGEFCGRLISDPATLGLYATDASPFYILPHTVAVPQDEADLQLIVRYAYENNLPMIPRGAGTGLSGESLGPGLILDLSENFRQMAEPVGDSIRVQVGVRHAELQRHLAKSGLRFPPNISSSAICTVGGMIATNASGGNLYVHGFTREHVRSLRVLWDDGELTNLTTTSNELTTGLRSREIRSQTSVLLAEHREIIQLTRPQTAFNRCGYVLHDVLTHEGLNLVKLLVGSEGTLAITTEAELHVIPLPGGRALALLGFDTLNEAVRAGLTLRALEGIVSCDLIDQRLLSLSRTALTDTQVTVPADLAAVLFVGVEANSPSVALAQLEHAVERIRQSFPSKAIVEPTSQPDGCELIERFRSAAVSGIYSITGRSRPVAFIEDTAVPGEELVRYISGLTEILRRFNMPGSFFIHVLTGQIHVRPLMDLNSPTDRETMWAIAEKVHMLAIGLGGTISGQHGTGLTRTPWVERQYGPVAKVFADLKRIFDPRNVLNPGKIVGPDPSRPAWPFRPLIPADGVRAPLLLWPTHSPDEDATRCNGCGECRTETPPVRMCPKFHATNTEAATPRAKANLFVALTAANDPNLYGDTAVRDIVDECINCKMCRTECRSKVNIPKLALELKARYHELRGLDRGDWFPARLESFMTIASNFAFTTNRLLRWKFGRWMLEKLLGISRHRLLMKFHHRTFLRRAKRARWTHRSMESKTKPRVAIFADLFVNHHDPHIGIAAVELFRHHGYEVHVPPRQRGSGVAALAEGDVETASEIALANVRVLAELIREGYYIVCPEPTAALTITQDYRDLLDDPDTTLVADNTFELTDFLWAMHESGQLRSDFTNRLNASIGHHVPCHIKALGRKPSGPRLLELIPGVTVHTIDRSCSGMAGSYGLRAGQLEASLRAGEPMLAAMRRPRILFGSTECGSCRMQMQHGTGKRTMHPVQYLAMAYGLMPNLEKRLLQPLETLATE